MTVELALLIAVGLLVSAGVVLTLFAAWRALSVRREERRMHARVGALRARLEHHAQSGFQDVERMFVELRAADDPPQLDAALRAAGGDLQALDASTIARLRELYERLGLVEHHTRTLRLAPDWRSRADSALLLGHLGVISAIPALAASVRDPDEDGSTVKAAAARALGMMREPGTAEALVAELAEPGDWSSPRIAEVLVALDGDALAACLGGLDHENANVRAWCCRVLGRLGDPLAVPRLVARLLDRSGPVRTVAAEALGLLGDSAATPALVEAMLRDPAAQVRAAAARALGRTADPAALSALVDALDDPDPWTRIRAVEALESLHPQEPDLLLEAVRSGRPESARAAALALERIGHVQRWVDALGSGPRGQMAEVEGRLVLVARLGGSGPLRRTLTTSADLKARARAASLLGQARDPDALADLARGCADAEWPVRIESLRAWVETAPDGVEPTPLLDALDDGEELVRVAALEGLVIRGDVGRLPAERLPGLAAQANLEARTAALELVRGTGGAVEREVAMQLRHDPSDTLRAQAIAVLGACCAGVLDPVFGSLLDALGDASEPVRAAAAAALGRFPESEATQALVQATFAAGPTLREEITGVLAARGLDALYDELDTFMASDSEEARLAVLWTLGKIGDEQGVPLLVAALDDPRARIRASAVGALGKIRSEGSRTALVGAMTDPDARTRAAATNALGRVGGAVVESVRAALDDPDPFVRGRACIAAGRIGDEACRPRLQAALQSEDPMPAILGLALLGGAESAAAVGALMDGAMLSRLDATLHREDDDVARAARTFLGVAEPGTDRQSWLGRLRRSLQGSRDADERLRALELLASFDLGELLSRLGAVVSADPDPRLRRRAVTLLSMHAAVGDPALLRGLRDPDPEVRLAALRAGPRLGADVGPAVLACADGSTELDAAAMDALVVVYRAHPVMLADLLMGATHPSERRAAIAALGRIGAPEMVPLLVVLLDDPSSAVRAEAVGALGRFVCRGHAEALDALEMASEDPEPSIRGAALAALVGNDATQDFMLESALAREPDPEVRLALVRALAARHDESALSIVSTAMTDVHPKVRRGALLTALGSPHSVGLDRFLEVMAAADPVEAQIVRTDAVSQGLGLGLLRALADGPVALRVAAARVLAVLDPSRFEESLILAGEDPSPAVRAAAVQALADCDSDAARQAVLRAGRDEDASVAALARAAVGR